MFAVRFTVLLFNPRNYCGFNVSRLRVHKKIMFAVKQALKSLVAAGYLDKCARGDWSLMKCNKYLILFINQAELSGASRSCFADRDEREMQLGAGHLDLMPLLIFTLVCPYILRNTCEMTMRGLVYLLNFTYSCIIIKLNKLPVCLYFF